MTREEAIKILKDLWRTKYSTYLETDIRKALEMAIQALEQEPCDDAISRQAVFEITWEEPSYTDALNVLTEVRDKVKALPSVKPQEPKTGHWIDDGFYAEGHSHKAFHCSKCGHNVLGFKEDLSKFCPNCGARMAEPQESEEV